MAGGKVVGAVEHHVRLCGKNFEIRGGDSPVEPDHLHFRVDGKQSGARSLHLAGADGLGAVEDLALEVGEVDLVGVRDRQAPDTRGGQVERRGRAEPTGTDNQRSSPTQPLLPLDPDLG
jgi:hypothetical protein